MPHELPPNFHQVKLDEERYFAHERQMKVPVCGNCGCVHSPTIKCEVIFCNKDVLVEDDPLTAADWKKLYDEAAAAFLDVQSALVRLLNAHHPKPFGGIVDVKERAKAIFEDRVECGEATQHARRTLHKYSPFADSGNVLTD